jgi:AcrR family transcriptional regulator
MSTTRTVRDRIRDEVTREILVVARAHLATEGAAALSLRSIARELEMAPSALYRYFSSRDALLSALILGAYESLADDAEAASGLNGGAMPGRPSERWAAVPRAMRAWALERPQEWGLIFGSPVPGYEAPQETVVPYIRLAAALVAPVVAGRAEGSLQSPAVQSPESSPDHRDALAASLQPVAEALLPDLSTETVAVALQAFTTLIGIISLEIFGHWRNTVLAPDVFFEATIANLAASIGLCP